MSLSTPTTSQLSTTLTGQLELSLSATFPLLPKAVFRVLAWLIAGVVVILYKYAGFIFLQMFVRHATLEEVEINGEKVRPLVEWGRLIKAGDPNEGTQAQLTASLAVITQGGTLTAGRLLTAPNGVTYQLSSDVALNAATVSLSVKAIDDPSGGEGYGTIGNLPNGTKLTLAVPVAAVAREATVTGIAVLGAEAESEDSYRSRVIRWFQRRPKGGAYADFWQWGVEGEGVANVYPYSSTLTPGAVEVYVESTAGDGTPSSILLDIVRGLITYDAEGRATRKSVLAGLSVLPITRALFAIEVANLQAPDLAATKTDLESAATEWLLSREPYIEGLSVLPRKDRITQPELAAVVAGVVSAKGGTFTGLTVRKSAVVTPAYTLGAGEKAGASGFSYI